MAMQPPDPASSSFPSSSPDSAGASGGSHYYRYRWWEAALVVLDVVVGLVLLPVGVGVIVWLLGFAYAAWRDWRGLLSLRGVLPWARYSRVEQIVLALVLLVAAPLFFGVYSIQVLVSALRQGGRINVPSSAFSAAPPGSSRTPSMIGAQWARIRAWPRAWQVMGALIASILVCACCASGLAVIGANSPTQTATTNQRGSGSNNLTGFTAPQMTATAQAQQSAQNAQNAQATQTAQQTAFAEAATATALAQPTATLTPLPTATPRPTAAPQPTKTPVPYVLSVAVTCASAVDYSYGQVCVHTHAYAQLTITVTYCSGYTATSKSLQGTVTANSSGNYTWNWTPETKCRGTADAYITDNWNGQYVSTDKQFTVQ